MLLYSYPVNGGLFPLVVRVIMPGDRYGLKDALTHERTEPLVEFFDARYAHTAHGQFTGARYYLSDISAHIGALRLQGGVPEWTVSADVMRALQGRLREINAG